MDIEKNDNYNDNNRGVSSVKWSDPGHFLKSEVKFFLSFLCILILHF